MATVLQNVVERFSLVSAFDRLVARMTEVQDGMDVLQQWASGALAIDMASAETQVTADKLRQVLWSVLSARNEAEGLIAELEARCVDANSVNATDMELADAVEELLDTERNMAILMSLPAFYKTSGGLSGVSLNYSMKQGDTLESVADRFFPGVEDGPSIIADASPDFDTNTELTNSAIGAALNVPYQPNDPADLSSFNWVFDSQQGLSVLGAGPTNDFELEDIGPAGSPLYSLKIISGTENYSQAIRNRLLTEKGSVSGFPTVGSRVSALLGNSMVTGAYASAWSAVDVAQAALDDPRTAECLSATVRREQDAVYIDLVVRPVNTEQGVRLSAAITISD